MDLIYNLDKQKCLRNIYVNDLTVDDIKAGILEINIPAEIDGIKIVSVGKLSKSTKPNMFFDFINPSIYHFAKDIKAIKFVMSEGPKNIMNMVCDLSNPVIISIPRSVQNIGKDAFRYTKFTNFEFAPKSKLRTVGEMAFFNCTFESEFVLPIKCVRIEQKAFDHAIFCKGFKIEENSLLEVIKEYAFFNTEFNMDTLVLPKNVTHIASHAFAYCYKLKRFETAENSIISAIGSGALQNSKIEEVIIRSKINEALIHLRMNCFSHMENLRKLDLSDTSIQNIPDLCCYYDIKLKEVFLPDNTLSIGSQAFDKCSLSVLILPSGLKEIKSRAFNNNVLQEISFKDNITSLTTIEESAFEGNKLFNLPKNIFSEITFCGDMAFALNDFEKLVLYPPKRSATIKKGIFSKCYNLKEVTLENNSQKWVKIYEKMFYCCENLVSLTLANTIKRLSSYCFANTGIVKIILGENITNLGVGIFQNCTDLAYCDLSKAKIKKIPNRTFSNNKNLKYLKLPLYITSISGKAWDGVPSSVFKSVLETSPFIVIE